LILPQKGDDGRFPSLDIEPETALNNGVSEKGFSSHHLISANQLFNSFKTANNCNYQESVFLPQQSY
jgi:hypothetical protein